ncbi:MAG TPA: Flp pilus assembly protein CpaB [Pirellulales bacterium]|nr:Flp pilus assembly protein CpaB [Pirellulales bacterium]
MRPKSIILLTLALGCGLVASIGINQVMANRRAAPTTDGAETTPIFVAAGEIGVGDPLTPQLIKLEPWPKERLPAGTIGKLEDVEGRRSRAKFYPGEPILEAKLLPKGENGGSAIDMIPKGMRVVPIRVDAVSGASGMILPGDRVDLLVHVPENQARGVPRAVTRTFLQNIKIFAVDDLYDRSGNDNNTMAAKTISVLVTPEQSELVALATQVGTVQLVMRNAVDDVAESTGGADLQKLLTGRSDAGDGPPGDPHSFITSLKLKAPEPPAPPPSVAPEPPDDVFVMTIIDGSVPREVEFRRGKLITPSTAAPPPSAAVEPPAASDSPPSEAGGQPPAETEKQEDGDVG